jgi:1-deoxy-D-xylulose 5-phosphate reductoisomerase
VERFLAGVLPFTAIAAVIENVLAAASVQPLDSLETAWRADAQARASARREADRLSRAAG